MPTWLWILTLLASVAAAMAICVLAGIPIGSLSIAVGVVLIGVIAYAVLAIAYRDEESTVWQMIAQQVSSPQAVIKQAITDEDEVVRLALNPSWAAFVVKHLKLFAVGAMFIVGFGASIVFTINPLLILGEIAVLSVYFAFVIYQRLEESYTIYVLTNERVLLLSGVFNRDSRDVQWRQVTNKSWNQSFLGRLLGFATVSLNTASEQAGSMQLVNIPRRYQVDEIINEQLEIHAH